MRFLLILALTAFLASPLAAQTVDAPAAPSTSSPASPAAPTAPTALAAPAGGKGSASSKEDLPNFHEVHPFLYRGGQPTAEGLKKLKEMGIGTIIDLRGNPELTYNEGKEARALGMKWINLPMSSQPPTQKQVNTFIKEAEAAASGKSNGPLFVHCAHGSDRTGCLVGIWRVTHDKYDYDKAYQEMRKYYFTPKFTRLSGTVKEYAQEHASSTN